MTRRESAALEAWNLELPESASARKLRYRLPDVTPKSGVDLYGLVNEKWIQIPYTVSGSYLVFDAPQELTAIELREAPADNTNLYLAIAGGAVLLILVVTISAVSARRKKKTAQETEAV